MKFTFKFLLSGDRVEHHTFTAITFDVAHANCCAWAQMAFAPTELIDFEWLP